MVPRKDKRGMSYTHLSGVTSSSYIAIKNLIWLLAKDLTVRNRLIVY